MADNPKPSKKQASAPVSVQAPDASKNETTPQSQLPPAKAYPPRIEPWDLPVELDPKIGIGKVYDFLNDPDVTHAGRDQGISEEFKYYNYGAVTQAQLESRKGHYFTVNWANKGAAADLILRMDYRQSHTRDKVTTLEIPYKAIEGGVKGHFSITGAVYKEFGDVNSWRISVVRNGKIVAQTRSFIW